MRRLDNEARGNFLRAKRTQYQMDEIKGRYIEGLIDTLDVIIMGGYYGEG